MIFLIIWLVSIIALTVYIAMAYEHKMSNTPLARLILIAISIAAIGAPLIAIIIILYGIGSPWSEYVMFAMGILLGGVR